METVTPSEVNHTNVDSPTNLDLSNKNVEKKKSIKNVGLKRTLGVATGISIIVGNMIGSGIFVSPKSVLRASNSIGLCLIMWSLCGVISLLGALCYAELGTIISESGGEFIYILRGFSSANRHTGRVLAFLYSWSSIMILKPTAFSALTLACSSYILGPIIGDCGSPETLRKLGAIVIMLISVFFNIYGSKLTGKVMVVLTCAKIIALVVVIIGGIVRLGQGFTKNFENSFEGTTSNVLKIASGFYGGLWAFDGWNNLNYVTEEIINPKRNLPLSIFISVPLVTVIYVFVNISYFTVMSKNELLASSAVAVTWSQSVLGPYFQWLLPLSVALSTFGAATASIFSASRLAYVAAREGFTLKVLTMVDINRQTPAPSIIFIFLLAIVYLIPSDIGDLIDIFSFTVWIFYGLTTASLIIMHFTMKSTPRTLKIPLVIPIIVLIISIYFVISPVINDPRIEYLGSIGVVLLGLVFYVPFVLLKYKIPYFNYFTVFVQNLLQVALPQKTAEE